MVRQSSVHYFGLGGQSYGLLCGPTFFFQTFSLYKLYLGFFSHLIFARLRVEALFLANSIHSLQRVNGLVV
jgi:hypothetical protein